TRRDRLRERRRERDPVPALERVEGRRRSTFVADEPVRIVLEDVELVGAAELADAPAPLRAERAAARVLERRDRVEERHVAASRQLGLERIRLQALLVHLEGDDVGALPAEELQRAVVRRRLDEHPAGSTDELDGRVED